MTTPNGESEIESEITFLMARTTSMAIVDAIDFISGLDPVDHHEHRKRAIEIATRDLILQFQSVFMTMDATHDHPPRERGQ